MLRIFFQFKDLPYLCIRNRETNGPFEQRATLNKVSKKLFEKNFRNRLEDMQKSFYLCNRF